jgi:hypothetical protein
MTRLRLRQPAKKMQLNLRHHSLTIKDTRDLERLEMLLVVVTCKYIHLMRRNRYSDECQRLKRIMVVIFHLIESNKYFQVTRNPPAWQITIILWM